MSATEDSGDVEEIQTIASEPDRREGPESTPAMDLATTRSDKVVSTSQLIMNFLYSYGQREHNNPLDKGDLFLLVKALRFVYGVLDKGNLSPALLPPGMLERLYEAASVLEADANWVFTIAQKWDKGEFGSMTMAEAKYIKHMWDKYGPEIEETEGTTIRGILTRTFFLKTFFTGKMTALVPDMIMVLSYLPPEWAAARNMGMGGGGRERYSSFESASLSSVS